MRLLIVDIGTGTQDILLFDSAGPLENSPHLVMPAPTQIVAQQVRQATADRKALLLTGTLMGGGPCHWAVEAHLQAGLSVYATPEAAATFNDDLDWVESTMGVEILSKGEARRMANVRRVVMGDLDLPAIETALAAFGIVPDYDGVALAVFDHGNAPPNVSDRTFRFNYLAERFARGGLLELGFRRANLPPEMTRLRAAARSVPEQLPVLVMDTAAAAVLGALEDPWVAAQPDLLVTNVGNFHCLAFHLVDGQIAGCFEHHTGELQPAQLEDMLRKLANGSLTNQEVYDSMGHGALILRPTPAAQPALAVLGPRRDLLRGSLLEPHFAVPHGDMMLAGCFGLLRAYAANYASAADAIGQRLAH